MGSIGAKELGELVRARRRGKGRYKTWTDLGTRQKAQVTLVVPGTRGAKYNADEHDDLADLAHRAKDDLGEGETVRLTVYPGTVCTLAPPYDEWEVEGLDIFQCPRGVLELMGELVFALHETPSVLDPVLEED